MNPAPRAASAAALALALALGHAPLAAAPAEVIVSAGRVEVRSAGTPIVEVLQKLGAATGMKVVVEGAAPRQPLRAHVVATTPAEAVLALLEGQSLSYALLYDASGTRIETLLITGPVGASAPRAAAATPAPPGRPGPARPDQDPDAPAEPEADFEELEEPALEAEPDTTPEAAAPSTPASEAAPAGAATPIPMQSFPRSPFTPGPEAAPVLPGPPATAPPPSTLPAAPSPTPESR